jgi:hypothetical protein
MPPPPSAAVPSSLSVACLAAHCLLHVALCNHMPRCASLHASEDYSSCPLHDSLVPSRNRLRQWAGVYGRVRGESTPPRCAALMGVSRRLRRPDTPSRRRETSLWRWSVKTVSSAEDIRYSDCTLRARTQKQYHNSNHPPQQPTEG